jgi:hypothetical protein
MKGNTVELASSLTTLLTIIVFLMTIKHQRKAIESKIDELKDEVVFFGTSGDRGIDHLSEDVSVRMGNALNINNQ